MGTLLTGPTRQGTRARAPTPRGALVITVEKAKRRGARVLTKKKGSVLPNVYDGKTLIFSSTIVQLFVTVDSLRD